MNRRRGANAIEFALCMPIFVLLVAATVDFGWLFYHRSTVDAAVAEGCREGALVDPIAGYPTIVAEEALIDSLDRNGLPCEDVACEAHATLVGAMPTQSVQCTLQVTYQPLFGLLAGNQRLRARTSHRLEWQRESALPLPPEG